MKTLLILFLTIFLFSKTIALADNEKKGGKETKSEIKIEKLETTHNEEEEDEDENEIEENEQEKNKFKIKGEITAYDGSFLTVNEQLIKIDPTVTEKLKIVGKLAVGMNAHIKGKIINGSFYTEEIVIDNRNKNKISPTPTPTISLTPSVSPTPTASTTPTVTPTPTLTINEEIEEEMGLKKLLEALSRLMDFLKNF